MVVVLARTDGCTPTVSRRKACSDDSRACRRAPWPAPPAAAAPEMSPSPGRSTMEARALRIHSEAERRRRERIIAHLTTLRKMAPDSSQMDKANVLAMVVCQLKDLKRKASEAAQPAPIPAEANGVSVQRHTGHGAAAAAAIGGTTYIRASVSCDDRPGLLADIAGACRGLRLRALRADVASMGGKTQCDMLLCREGGGVGGDGMGALEEAVRQALAGVAFPETAHGRSNSGSTRQRTMGMCSANLNRGQNTGPKIPEKIIEMGNAL